MADDPTPDCTEKRDGAVGVQILSMRGISKAFGGVAALDNVSFSLRAGEVHALVGENGAGKSTLIKVLTGVYAPDSGEVVYAGDSVRFVRPLDAQLAGISTIYQEINLVPLISVARNIFLGREPRTRLGLVDFRRINAEAEHLLDGVGIHLDVRRALGSFGTGTRQMVAIARAISTDARIVIMDEPTSSLEPREVATLFDVIRRLTRQGIAVIYVSHRMEELYRICERVTVLRDGHLVHAGELADLSRRDLIGHMLGRSLQAAAEVAKAETEPTDAMQVPPVLRATDLRRRHMLHGISLEVAPGEIVGLGGLLGSGRSETARAIAGAMKVDDGEVVVTGRKVRNGSTASAIRLGISLLTEDRKSDGIIPNLSVRENIVLAALPKLSHFGIVSDRQQKAIVDTFIRRLRIKAASPEQKVGELSGGNQQKVLLARWLCLSPRVLLLDEPTRGIDVGAKAEVQALINELAAEGLAVVLISSELEELIAGAQRIVALREGMVIGQLGRGQISEQALMNVLSADRQDSTEAGDLVEVGADDRNDDV